MMTRISLISSALKPWLAIRLSTASIEEWVDRQEAWGLIDTRASFQFVPRSLNHASGSEEAGAKLLLKPPQTSSKTMEGPVKPSLARTALMRPPQAACPA